MGGSVSVSVEPSNPTTKETSQQQRACLAVGAQISAVGRPYLRCQTRPGSWWRSRSGRCPAARRRRPPRCTSVPWPGFPTVKSRLARAVVPAPALGGQPGAPLPADVWLAGDEPDSEPVGSLLQANEAAHLVADPQTQTGATRVLGGKQPDVRVARPGTGVGHSHHDPARAGPSAQDHRRSAVHNAVGDHFADRAATCASTSCPRSATRRSTRSPATRGSCSSSSSSAGWPTPASPP